MCKKDTTYLRFSVHSDLLCSVRSVIGVVLLIDVAILVA